MAFGFCSWPLFRQSPLWLSGQGAPAHYYADSFDFFRQVIHAADLNLKMEEAQAYGILSALLSTINAKETLSVTCDYFAVFDFMVDSLVADIFE